MQNDVNSSCDVIGQCPSFWSSCTHACVDVNFFSIGKNFSTICNKHMLERSCGFFEELLRVSVSVPCNMLTSNVVINCTFSISQESAYYGSVKLSAANRSDKPASYAGIKPFASWGVHSIWTPSASLEMFNCKFVQACPCVKRPVCTKPAVAWFSRLKFVGAYVTITATRNSQRIGVCLYAVCRLAYGAVKVAAQNHECGI